MLGPLEIVLLAAAMAWLVGLALRDILSRAGRPSATAWEDTHAAQIHVARLLDDELGEMTPGSLNVSAEAIRRFHEKFLLTREAICFVALASLAGASSKLGPVVVAYGRFAAARKTFQGFPTDEKAFAEDAFSDIGRLFDQPDAWAQGWLAEFRNDPDDPRMITAFALHCLTLFEDYKKTLGNTELMYAGPVDDARAEGRTPEPIRPPEKFSAAIP